MLPALQFMARPAAPPPVAPSGDLATLVPQGLYEVTLVGETVGYRPDGHDAELRQNARTPGLRSDVLGFGTGAARLLDAGVVPGSLHAVDQPGIDAYVGGGWSAAFRFVLEVAQPVSEESVARAIARAIGQTTTYTADNLIDRVRSTDNPGGQILARLQGVSPNGTRDVWVRARMTFRPLASWQETAAANPQPVTHPPAREVETGPGFGTVVLAVSGAGALGLGLWLAARAYKGRRK